MRLYLTQPSWTKLRMGVWTCHDHATGRTSCGSYDGHADAFTGFTASAMCCACGGGVIDSSSTGSYCEDFSAIFPERPDVNGNGCEYYDTSDSSNCGAYDTSDFYFNANGACCACEGGLTFGNDLGYTNVTTYDLSTVSFTDFYLNP